MNSYKITELGLWAKYNIILNRIAVIFHIQSVKRELACPFCVLKTTRAHSTYQREIQDLSIQDKAVRIGRNQPLRVI